MQNKKGYTHIGSNIYSLEPRYRKVQDEKYLKKQCEGNMVYLSHEDADRLREILEIKNKRISQYKSIVAFGSPFFFYGLGAFFNRILDLF